MEKEMKARIVHKHDIEANWLKASGFVPKQGEFIVYDKDSNCPYERIKIGDGINNVNILPFTHDAYSAVTPQDYGAKGDGSTDDTIAFQNALSANRVVFVPGGTYKLSGELVVGDNCQMELAQDVVLNFTQTSGNCITMNRSAFLVGNHATVNVPYGFTGHVINVDTSVHTDNKDVQPWTHWSPMWKTARYVTDINICKAESNGIHHSTDGSTSGTAVYISANGSAAVSFMWGINFSGLRIAGAFEYGIRAVNFNSGWNHEMRFEAFMDAIKIGVSLENCNNAYISATIQPRAAANGTVYAKHGIQLINSHNTDLTGSRVWDWNAKTSLWTYDKDNVHQHFAMYGNCYGTILNDFYYYSIPSGFTDIRELIYTDTPANYDSLIILQEPFTKWFKKVDNLPYFNNGVDGNQRLCLKSEQDALFHTKEVAQFTNQLPLATDANGAVYEGRGYSTGHLSPSDPPVKVEDSTYKHTGFIPCKPKSVIRFSGIKLHSSTGYDRIFAYSDYNTLITHTNSEAIMSGTNYFFDYAETEDGFIITLKDVVNLKDVKYFRINLRHEDVGTNPVITVDEEIVYAQVGFLDDGINMSYENVVGLNEHYVGINRRALKISSASTDEQYPTAKAVYDLVNGAFEEQESVLYVEQTLTDEQKAQARENIDAMCADEMFTIRETTMPDYTNQIPISVDTDGSVYNGVGYISGKRLESEGNLVDHGDCIVTGFIPVKKGDIIRIKDLSRNDFDTTVMVALYQADMTTGTGKAKTIANLSTSEQYGSRTIDGNLMTWDTSTISYYFWNDFRWLRVTTRVGAIVTINEEIVDIVNEQLILKPTVKVPAENLEVDISSKPLSGKTVVCFGDSIFGYVRDETSVTSIIAKETGATVHNVGFNGCRMSVHPTTGYAAFSMWALAKAIAEKNWTAQDAQAASGASYFPDHLALLKTIDFNEVDMVIIHYGTNDYTGGNPGVAINNDNDPDDYSTLCGALRYSVEKLLGAYPHLRIFVSLPAYRYWSDTGIYPETHTNYRGNSMPEFVNALRNTATEYNLPVIDCYYGMGVNRLNVATMTSDGTHHSFIGRQVLGEYIAGHLMSRQTSGKAGVDTATVNSLISAAIGDAIGGAY